jgi:hypothetical protein
MELARVKQASPKVQLYYFQKKLIGDKTTSSHLPWANVAIVTLV